MQETWVWSLVQEDSTCRRATKPLCHKYWSPFKSCLQAATTEPVCRNHWSPHLPKAYALRREATTIRSPHAATKRSPCLLQLEKAQAKQQRSHAVKRNKINNKGLKKKKRKHLLSKHHEQGNKCNKSILFSFTLDTLDVHFKKRQEKNCKQGQEKPGSSLVVQWSRLCTPKARGLGSILSPGADPPHAPTKTWKSQINKGIFFKDKKRRRTGKTRAYSILTTGDIKGTFHTK